MFAGGFPQSSAVPFAAALALVAAGLAMYACGGSVYAPATSEDCYRVIRCASCLHHSTLQHCDIPCTAYMRALNAAGSFDGLRLVHLMA